ncbi:MAG: class I SAM-dependent methyltransferase [Deltaproteobacteria bacterium]|nr:MAG: class I SAM-dependent methyltransferase [Deltaproteobacteria bacterium]
MKDYRKEYYEQPTFWNQDYLKMPAEKERIQEIINAVPPDTGSILDVGCGNGAFVNTFVGTFSNKKVVGLDSSEEALKYVRTDKIRGNITSLPFENDTFDLVLCLEVLEHLPEDDFREGISELQRVSKSHIVITVPNQEDLELSLVMCPKCYCWFIPYLHMRSFNKDNLDNLFKDLKLLCVKEIGPVIEYRSYNYSVLRFYHFWRRPLPPETAICPQCGYQNKKELRNRESSKYFDHLLSLLVSLIKPLVRLITPLRRKRRWLLAVYGKSSR